MEIIAERSSVKHGISQFTVSREVRGRYESSIVNFYYYDRVRVLLHASILAGFIVGACARDDRNTCQCAATYSFRHPGSRSMQTV